MYWENQRVYVCLLEDETMFITFSQSNQKNQKIGEVHCTIPTVNYFYTLFLRYSIIDSSVNSFFVCLMKTF